MSGWIKLHRSLNSWEWYDDHNATRLLVHLLISVNYEAKRWKGVEIEAGSLVTSFSKLAEQTGLSIKQVRGAMQKLENSQEVTREAARKGQLVTLVKWDELQSGEEKRASNKATKGQAKGNERATTKEGKEIKESKKKERTNYSTEVILCYEKCFDLFPEHLQPNDDDAANRWLDTIDKLNRIDKIPFEIIERITEATRKDSFWSKNFLSLTKLRKTKDGIKYIIIFNEQIKSNGLSKNESRTDQRNDWQNGVIKHNSERG